MGVTKKTKNYEEVGRIVSDAIADKKKAFWNKEKAELSLTRIIEDLKKVDKGGISPAALWNYQKGRRAVPQAKAELMAKYLFEGDPKGGQEFISKLERATKDGITSHRSAGDRLAAGQPLRMDVTIYPPFSGTIKKMVDHLCRLSALSIEPSVRGLDFDMREALWDNEIDLSVSYFANLYRAVHVHFWPTTIKVGIGAVILEENSESLNLIKEVLAGKKSEDKLLVLPVLVEREVGAIHCLETLQYTEKEVEFVENMTAENLTAKGIAVKLRATVERLKQRGSAQVAVAVVDEYTSFQILLELQELGKTSGRKPEDIKPAGIPVLPLSSRKAARESPRRDLPASFLSIGCSRKQEELRDVLEQSLNLFLATEVESNALRLARLHQELLGEVSMVAKRFYPEGRAKDPDPESYKNAAAKAFKAAYGWCLYALGLDQQSIENVSRGGLPWGPILKRAREEVLARLADEKERIRDHVSLYAGPEDAPPSEKVFKELCESLDLRMQLHGPQREYVLEDRAILIRTLQDGLRGLPVGLPIEPGKDGGRVENLHPKHDAETNPQLSKEEFEEKLRVVGGYLRDLEEFYTKRVGYLERVDRIAGKGDQDNQDNDVLMKIRLFRGDLQKYYIKSKSKRMPTFGKSENDRILLASFGKGPTRYLGSACLRPYISDDYPDCLELFYLWVRQDFRQLAIGDQIVNQAKHFAQAKSKLLVVEVLPTLNEAVTYFRKRKFHRQGMTTGGRLLLMTDGS